MLSSGEKQRRRKYYIKIWGEGEKLLSSRGCWLWVKRYNKVETGGRRVQKDSIRGRWKDRATCSKRGTETEKS